MKRSLDDIMYILGIDKLSQTPHGYKGCCAINPDHIDHKPSMHIHIEKGLVKCFACGSFKTLFDFLIDKGVPFDEAVDFFFTDFSKEKRVQKEGLKEWVLGRKIPKSMIDRGFTITTLKHFKVGYDSYEKRITIPLEYNGVLYGIQYRAYPKKFWASDGFVKDNFIYNYEPTEERFYSEGFTDVWRIWQNGTKNVSGLLTASPSEGQLALMRRHKRILLALDNDKAGWRGAFKIHRELGREIDINVIVFSGKDAGECSKSRWMEASSKSITFTEFEVEFIRRNKELYEELTKKQ